MTSEESEMNIFLSWFLYLLPIILSALCLIAILVYRRTIYLIIVCFPRDIRGLYYYGKIKADWYYCLLTNKTVAEVFDKTVKANLNKVCWYFEDTTWTYSEAQKFTLKIGNFFKNEGYQKADSIALLMLNRPEYPCIWIGLSRLGVKTALINYNLRSDALLGSISSVDSKAVIVDVELIEGIQELIKEQRLDPNVTKIYLYNGSQNPTPLETAFQAIDLNTALITSSCAQIPKTATFYDTVCFMYTSGTTGLPKAAAVNSARFFILTNIHYALRIRSNDIVMTPIPLYHASGGIVATGQAVFFGVSQVILKKFSATRFWDQCVKYNVTTSIYIGELCRYLLKQPVCEAEKQHKIRFMFGNGLKIEVWEAFIERFKIPYMAEFYGSTEGNVSVCNIFGKIGAVGFIPIFLKPFLPAELVVVDEFTGDIIRDPKTGLAIIVSKRNEPGELVATIIKGHPVLEFEGYASKESTEQKIAHNVFKKGDSVFRTGDIMLHDEYNYLYFKDRCGDTFRWKGENVSTAEVEGVINKITGMNDVAVYGVEIPGNEGKAGMAAIVDPDGVLDIAKLAPEFQTQLPPYAVPKFIRICAQIPTTGTFKLQKLDMKLDGFDVTKVSDKIYFFCDETYITLDTDTYNKIISQEIKV